MGLSSVSRGWRMRFSDLEFRQTHLTHPLLPVLETPGDPRCPVCSTVHLPLDWPALGLDPSLQPPVWALQRLQGSPQVHKRLGYCP